MGFNSPPGASWSTTFPREDELGEGMRSLRSTPFVDIFVAKIWRGNGYWTTTATTLTCGQTLDGARMGRLRRRACV